MKLRLALPAFIICLASLAPAQDASYVTNMLQGGGKPLTMKPSALTADFHAIELKTGGGGGGPEGLMEMIMSPMMMIMGMMGSMGGESSKEDPPFALFSAMGLSWTTGETQAFLGQTYLVTYKLDLDFAKLSKMSSAPSDLSNMDLRLQLVRADAIQSFTPRPDVTPAAYIQMLKSPKPTPAKPPKPAKP